MANLAATLAVVLSLFVLSQARLPLPNSAVAGDSLRTIDIPVEHLDRTDLVRSFGHGPQTRLAFHCGDFHHRHHFHRFPHHHHRDGGSMDLDRPRAISYGNDAILSDPGFRGNRFGRHARPFGGHVEGGDRIYVVEDRVDQSAGPGWKSKLGKFLENFGF